MTIGMVHPENVMIYDGVSLYANFFIEDDDLVGVCWENKWNRGVGDIRACKYKVVKFRRIVF